MADIETAETHRIRVLVAEHNAILREGICRLLSAEADLDLIAVAHDAAESVALTRRLAPDVLLLEFDLPRTTGLRVLELLPPAGDTRVLLLGAAISATTTVEALELGARGVLQHDATPAMLSKSIRTVARGEYWVQRQLVGDLLSHVTVPSDPFDLTAREREIVELVVRGHSNKAIAERCRITADTVKHHLTSIFDKTGASTRVELAVFALHHGVAAPDAAPPLQARSSVVSPALFPPPDRADPRVPRAPHTPEPFARHGAGANGTNRGALPAD